MIDWSALGEWLLTVGSYVAVLGSILGVWHKWVYKPLQEYKEEKEEERTRKLIKAFEESNKPNIELVKETHRRANSLEEIAEQSLQMHEEWRKKFDSHDRRIWELERVSSGGKTTMKYTERYEGEAK